MDAELAIFSRQNSSADGTEKSQNGLGSVTGRAQRTHTQMIVTLGEFLTVAVHDQWKMGEPGGGDGQIDHVAPLTENREVQDYRKHHRHVYDLLASTSAKTLQSQISK